MTLRKLRALFVRHGIFNGGALAEEQRAYEALIAALDELIAWRKHWNKPLICPPPSGRTLNRILVRIP